MDPRTWTVTSESAADILLLRGPEVHLLRFHSGGGGEPFRRQLDRVLAELAAGGDLRATAAEVVRSLDARAMTRAELGPGGRALTLFEPGAGPRGIAFDPGDAAPILGAILAESGGSFGPAEEKVGLGEALRPPLVVGVVGGLLMALVAWGGAELAESLSDAIQRRPKIRKIALQLLGSLGPGWKLAVGVGFAVAVAGWALLRVARRPRRTVFRPIPG